jgi:ubiquinone/menaquinone biosynthesis C-methylase UbiE
VTSGRDNGESRFKAAVERNFDQSAQVYDVFEEKHHLFESLVMRQFELIAPSRPRRVLDIGCGTGISTLALYKAVASESPNVYAIDISESMLIKAKDRCRDVSGIYFIRGDAENLETLFHETFDAIFYTASIFLIPRFCESIKQAGRLLVPEGVISLSFYSGLFDGEGEDAVGRTFPDLRYQYGAFPIQDLVSCFDSMPEFRTTWVDFRFETSTEFLFDFLSIPAQSAGLFPKIPYLDRIPKIREICAAMAGKVGPVFMGWKVVIARKPGQPTVISI